MREKTKGEIVFENKDLRLSNVELHGKNARLEKRIKDLEEIIALQKDANTRLEITLHECISDIGVIPRRNKK